MNAIKLLELAIALAPLVPSDAASPRACREWQLCREAWLSALTELDVTEEMARDLASRRIAMIKTDFFQ